MDRLLAPLPPHAAGRPEWKNKGPTCIDTAKPVGIRQLMHLLKEWLSPGKES